MPILADRSDLLPRARQLLAEQHAECSAILEPLLEMVLGDLDQELFRIAEQSTGGRVQHEALDALRRLKESAPRFRGHLTRLLEQQFAGGIGLPLDASGTTDPQPGPDNLELVDPGEFDESMALEDLATRAELHAGNALFDLGLRYAVLAASPPLDSDALPCGPRALTVALRGAADEIGLQHDHRLLFYRLCDRRLFAAAESLYGKLNRHLVDSGVLPHLRNYVPRRGATTPRDRRPPATGEAREGTPLAPAVSFTPPPGQAAPMPAMAELEDLLEARRTSAAHPDVAAPPPQRATPPPPAPQPANVPPHPHAATARPRPTPVRMASTPDLQAALAALQGTPPASGRPRSGQELGRDLLAELERAEAGSPVRLAPGQRDAVDLIGLLSDQLREQTRSEGIAQQLLAGLQVTLLQVALSDKEFFTVRNHPARRLLNLVLDTADLWLDRSGENPDGALHQRLQRSVQHVVSGVHDDPGVLEREADDLDAHLRLLLRRAEITERRQVEAAQGRDRLREARHTADTAIGERLAKRVPTPLVHALLEHAWIDALTLTLLREGEDSDVYRRRLAIADELLEPQIDTDPKQLAADLNIGLTQVGLHATEADQITRYALDLPQRASPQGTTPPSSQTELLIRLKARRKPDEEVAAPTNAGAVPKAPLGPAEQHAMDELKTLPFGTWLEFTVNQQGQTVLRKLAWYAPTSGRCLLVNVRGNAAPERTLEQVARLMARGQVQVAASTGSGILDRAWSVLVTGLRKFSGNAPAPEAKT